jgi:hypothetical protein
MQTHVSCSNLVIAKTKHADARVQTNGACNVTATFICLIQAVRLALRLPMLHLSPFGVSIFTRLNGSRKTCLVGHGMDWMKGLDDCFRSAVNPLTLELNPSAQLFPTRFFLGILLLEPCISLIYAWNTNKCTNYSFSILIMYGSSYMLRHYIAIFRERS